MQDKPCTLKAKLCVESGKTFSHHVAIDSIINVHFSLPDLVLYTWYIEHSAVFLTHDCTWIILDIILSWPLTHHYHYVDWLDQNIVGIAGYNQSSLTWMIDLHMVHWMSLPLYIL